MRVRGRDAPQACSTLLPSLGMLAARPRPQVTEGGLLPTCIRGVKQAGVLPPVGALLAASTARCLDWVHVCREVALEHVVLLNSVLQVVAVAWLGFESEASRHNKLVHAGRGPSRTSSSVTAATCERPAIAAPAT